MTISEPICHGVSLAAQISRRVRASRLARSDFHAGAQRVEVLGRVDAHRAAGAALQRAAGRRGRTTIYSRPQDIEEE